MTIPIIEDHGPNEVLRRLSNPYWFQALGCVLGFDWHSSGITTTVCGALKEGVKGLEVDLGLFVAGGKGGASRKTPTEVQAFSEKLGRDLTHLAYASRMSAKVDNTAVQDGYQLYHHNLFFTSDGQWAVVQQGMNENNRMARRYHWLGEKVHSFVCEPHAAICAEGKEQTLNLVAHESGSARRTITWLAAEEEPETVLADLKRVQHVSLPHRHHILTEDLDLRHLENVLHAAHDARPHDFEALLALKGLGPKSLRALTLVSEVVYGAPASLRDPATYSFAHGGKDGHPFPVDRVTYDQTIHFLNIALHRAKLGYSEKLDAFKRLASLAKT
jgi:hypothetical protein